MDEKCLRTRSETLPRCNFCLLILALGEAAKAVEVAEQLVRAVYEMNDHAFCGRSRSSLSSRALRTSDAGVRCNEGLPSPACKVERELHESIRRTISF
jgi:hypothetical protein